MTEVSHSQILAEIATSRDQQHQDSQRLERRMDALERVLTGGLEGEEGVLGCQRRHERWLQSLQKKLPGSTPALDTGRHEAQADTVTVERWKAWSAVAICLLTTLGTVAVALLSR